MKRNPVYVLLFLLASLILFPACDDENFSADPSLALSFSQDTLRMDTILAGIGTSTHILKVYNRNKESLIISSIVLADAANSGFRINVDGMISACVPLEEGNDWLARLHSAEPGLMKVELLP